jgi:hypothetical protein
LEERRAYERFDLSLPARIKVMASSEEGHPEMMSLLAKNISSGGAYLPTLDPLSEGTCVKITLVLGMDKLKDLADHYAYVRVRGTVLRREPTGMAIGFEEDYRTMLPARIRKRRVRWNSSVTPDVVGYRIYWSVGGSVSYDSDSSAIGNVTALILPDDIPLFPLVAADVELGVTAVDPAGNESEMVKASAHFSFAPPDAPTNLVIEYV